MNDFPLPTKELQSYAYLKGRRRISKVEQQAHDVLRKGYTGEKKFAQLVHQQLDNDYVALYDILLQDKGTIYQLDCLLIFSNQLYLNEIKYYQGEFELKEDNFYDCLHQKQYRNPLHQITRSSLLFQNLLNRLHVKLPLQSQLVFNHHQFTLFHTSRNSSIILPSQLQAFMERLKKIPGKLQAYHYRLADQIKKHHIPASPYERMPTYEYHQLQKGILCHHCREMMKLQYRQLHCVNCSYNEIIDSGVLRSIIEFQILFANKKIKTGMITDWCGSIVSKKTTTRILKAYLKLHSNTSGSYYKFYLRQ